MEMDVPCCVFNVRVAMAMDLVTMKLLMYIIIAMAMDLVTMKLLMYIIIAMAMDHVANVRTCCCGNFLWYYRVVTVHVAMAMYYVTMECM